MGLSHSDATVQIKWIVGLRWGLRDRQRGGMGELIRIANDEGVEGVARIKLVVHRLEIEARLLGTGGQIRDRWFGLVANKIELQLRHPDFDEHGMKQFTVGLCQPFSKRA